MGCLSGKCLSVQFINHVQCFNHDVQAGASIMTSEPVQYDLPEAMPISSESCPPVSLNTPQAALPEVSPQWLECGGQMISPSPQQSLEGDRTQEFKLFIPGASTVALLPQLQAQNDPLGLLPTQALPKEAILLKACGHDGFQGSVVLPRRPVLDVVVCMGKDSKWSGMMRFAVMPESQHIRDRPDLWVSSPNPRARDPRMGLVQAMMKAIDSNHDGVLSRREYLACIRRDRKYAGVISCILMAALWRLTYSLASASVRLR
jgi:hypothetical protein